SANAFYLRLKKLVLYYVDMCSLVHSFPTRRSSDLTQLEEANNQLKQAKLSGVTPEETARLTKENAILRNIVIRERQEEARRDQRSEEHTSELQSRGHLVCRLLREKKQMSSR